MELRRARAEMGEPERDDQRALLQLRQLKGSSLATVTVVPTAVDRCLTGGRRGQEVVGSAQVGEFQQSSSCNQRLIATPVLESKSQIRLPQQVLGSLNQFTKVNAAIL